MISGSFTSGRDNFLRMEQPLLKASSPAPEFLMGIRRRLKLYSRRDHGFYRTLVGAHLDPLPAACGPDGFEPEQVQRENQQKTKDLCKAQRIPGVGLHLNRRLLRSL